MKYFVDSIKVSLEELERIRKEECTRNSTYSEALQRTSIDLEKSIIHFNFTFTLED